MFPLFVDVRDDHGKNSGSEHALQKAPEQELGEGLRRRSQQRGNRYKEGSGHDHALSSEAVGDDPGERGGEGDRERRGGHNQADTAGRDLERTRKHRQQRLRREDGEEGAKSCKNYGRRTGALVRQRRFGHYFQYAMRRSPGYYPITMTQPVPVLNALVLLLSFGVPSFSESIPELLHRMDLSARSFTGATADIRVITHTAVVDKDETESGTLIVRRYAPD